jgi:manganese transport protein
MGLIKLNISKKQHKPRFAAIEILKYIGPGFLAALAFIDPGNWAANVVAGSMYGYSMLWVVTISTVIFIVFQHDAAHLGIATGYCLSEASSIFLKPWLSRTIIFTALGACIATAMAEILGGAIALNMLFALPLSAGMILVAIFTVVMLFTNSYKKIERLIIGFVGLIGLSFIFELSLVHVQWGVALASSVTPDFPKGSMLIIMSVLGSVVMPGNLFLHSEIIQSRQLNMESEEIKEKQLKYEFLDTAFSTFVGWAINSAMIIIAAAIFYTNNITVTELSQAHELLKPILGNFASVIFASALLLAAVASSITVGMAGGSIFAGIYGEPYDIKDSHSKTGVLITIIAALLCFLFVKNPLSALIYSQAIMSIQLPITIFFQIYVTSSKKIMGLYRNTRFNNALLWFLGIIISLLNVMFFIEFFKGFLG